MINTSFICTDFDSAQYCKQLSDFEFMYVECRKTPRQNYVFCRALIDLRYYTLDDIWEYCEGYYNSFEEMVASYGFKSAFRVMAECIFEQFTLADMSEIQTFETFEEAEQAIRNHIQTH